MLTDCCAGLDYAFSAKSRNSRLAGIDLLKIGAIVCVLLNHCFSAEQLDAMGAVFWIYNAVPVFMIIAGFNFSRKYCKVCKNGLRGWYSAKEIRAFAKRVLLPYAFFACVQLVVYPLTGYASALKTFVNLFIGGLGAGGYYVFVFVQIFAVFPLLYRAFDRHPIGTAVFMLSAQILNDVVFNLATPLNQPLVDGIYRLFAVRYFAPVLGGMILYRYYDKITARTIAYAVLAGLCILTAMFVCGDGTYFLFRKWTVTSLPVTVWCWGITAAVVMVFENAPRIASFKPVNVFANATLHIFFVQQIYFSVIHVYGGLGVAGDVAVCLVVGIAAYIAWQAAVAVAARKKPHF